MPRRKVQVTIHPLGCLFWLAVFVAFIAALNWAVSL